MKRAIVVATEQLADRFRLITIEGAALKGTAWTPGQKILIAMGSAFVAILHADRLGSDCRPRPNPRLCARGRSGKRVDSKCRSWRRMQRSNDRADNGGDEQLIPGLPGAAFASAEAVIAPMTG